MVKLATIIVCLLMLGSAIVTRPANADGAKQKIAAIALCDLLSNPKLYEQKEVRLKAIYRVGYEWQELYCMDCWGTETRVWLEFGDDFDSCTRKGVRRRLEGDEGTYSVTLIGKLSGLQGGYGHMGAYRFKFLATCAEQAKLLLKDGRSPTLVPKEKIAGSCSK